jgi:hypothetical protein
MGRTFLRQPLLGCPVTIPQDGAAVVAKQLGDAPIALIGPRQTDEFPTVYGGNPPVAHRRSSFPQRVRPPAGASSGFVVHLGCQSVVQLR